ncbi:unnamed protein product [Rotaria sp. Silwood2]|nr:unnamed protein product [Rotaria sp. Silwood2]CAF4273625.1 unnamed protein product [Rotaria sp. Silwood2]
MNNHEEDDQLWSIPSNNKSVWYLSSITRHTEQQLSRGHSLLIVFETVRIASTICSVLGILSNIALICVITNTSFRHVSYGLLIVTIAFFDIIRLVSAIFYYLLFAKIIPINLITQTIHIAIDRYPIFVVNWCKVLMSIERLLTVRYWETCTHLDWRSKHKRKQRRRFIYSIIFVLVAGLISQHPNFLLERYESVHINYKRLMLTVKQNPNFLYAYYRFNESLFTLISYLILDTTMPILSALLINILLLREIQKLSLSLQVKVKESIGILFFLTALSVAMLPRAFIAFYIHYLADNNNIFFEKSIMFFYICLGFEFFNHAITGYACFLSSTLLRCELKNMICTRYIATHLRY